MPQVLLLRRVRLILSNGWSNLFMWPNNLSPEYNSIMQQLEGDACTTLCEIPPLYTPSHVKKIYYYKIFKKTAVSNKNFSLASSLFPSLLSSYSSSHLSPPYFIVSLSPLWQPHSATHSLSWNQCQGGSSLKVVERGSVGLERVDLHHREILDKIGGEVIQVGEGATETRSSSWRRRYLRESRHIRGEYQIWTVVARKKRRRGGCVANLNCYGCIAEKKRLCQRWKRRWHMVEQRRDNGDNRAGGERWRFG